MSITRVCMDDLNVTKACPEFTVFIGNMTKEWSYMPSEIMLYCDHGSIVLEHIKFLDMPDFAYNVAQYGTEDDGFVLYAMTLRRGE